MYNFRNIFIFFFSLLFGTNLLSQNDTNFTHAFYLNGGINFPGKTFLTADESEPGPTVSIGYAFYYKYLGLGFTWIGRVNGFDSAATLNNDYTNVSYSTNFLIGPSVFVPAGIKFPLYFSFTFQAGVCSVYLPRTVADGLELNLAYSKGAGLTTLFGLSAVSELTPNFCLGISAGRRTEFANIPVMVESISDPDTFEEKNYEWHYRFDEVSLSFIIKF
ncbi:MAG: hypothetical protein H7X71_08415 [Chitinophagales bacterium]|nr:hypothetical protein [Chitinophagales bacterium]